MNAKNHLKENSKEKDVTTYENNNVVDAVHKFRWKMGLYGVQDKRPALSRHPPFGNGIQINCTKV